MLAQKPYWWIPSVFGVTLLIIILCTIFFIPIKADDIWWHLRTGKFILSTLSIPDSNIFSFTCPDNTWLAHEWLAEVIFYFVYKYLGYTSLIALGVILNAVTCALVYNLAYRYSKSPYISSLITLLASLMMLCNFSLRPYLFGNLFFILVLYAMENPNIGGRIRPVVVFLLFFVWANLHGSFIIGLALILLYFAAALVSYWTGQNPSLAHCRKFGFEFIIATLACVFTPHHIYGLIFPFTYMKNAFTGELNYLTNISEWQPTGLNTPLGYMVTFYVLLACFSILGSGLAPLPVHIGLLVGFSFFAYSIIRNIPLLGIAAIPILARHLPLTLRRIWRIMTRHISLARTFEHIHKRSVKIDQHSRKVLLPTLLGAFMLFSFGLPSLPPLGFQRLTNIKDLADLSPGFYPRGIIAELKRQKKGNRIFNYFNWAGAFIWELYPNKRVFIDQRNDCYTSNVFLDYFAVHNLERGWQDILAHWHIDMVAYPQKTKLARQLRCEKSWTIAYEDEQSVLFVRKDKQYVP